MSNLRRFIMLLVVLGQLAWPIQSYAFIPAVLGLVEMAGAAMEGVSVGAVITGAAITIGGSAASTCATCTNKQPTAVAFGPAGMAVPPGWGRGADGTPTPPATTPPSGGNGDPNAPPAGSAPLDIAGWYAFNRPDLICGPNSSAAVMTATYFRCWANGSSWTTSWTPPAPPACPGGYVMNGNSCSIGPGGPDAVPKPTGTDCQAYFKAGKFSFDNLNPACLSPDGTVTGPDGTKVSIANGTISVLPTGYSQPVATIIPTTTGGAVVSVLGSGADGKAQTNSTVIDYVTGTPTVTGQVTSAGNNIANPPVAGVGSGGAPIKITCQDIGTCGVSQEATQQNVLTNVKSIAGALANGQAVPQITQDDYAPAIGSFNKLLPQPGDYKGVIASALSKLGFPQAGGQCSLQRTVTLFNRTFTLEFVPQGLCDPYQQVANYLAWGLVLFLGWRQVKSLAGDKTDLTGGD
ncbi:hypothetical protein ABH313_21095 [Chromobacterium vaccinii]|uniref:hypothetical protein n=1 Tax=Chromobacterium vaccinii TaxID=1108595 RepID=UPI00326161F3